METRRQVFEKLKEIGADIVVDPFPGTGWFVIQTVDDFELLLDDPEVYLAKSHHITVERFRRWRTFYNEQGQCTGTTKLGRRCRIYTHVVSPNVFVPGVDDRCDIHR